MQYILLMGLMLLVAAASSKVLYRYGIPTLIGFLALGIISGSEALGVVHFKDYMSARWMSDIALMFIMFSGGFGTSWKAARGSALMAGTLATLGVAITALLTGMGAYLFLGFSMLEVLLLGSIIASTDAASVFSILRSKKLNIKCNVASTLEVESGSNDPMAYMLTVAVLGFMGSGGGNLAATLLSQLIIGAALGYVLGRLAVLLINIIKLDVDGLYYVVALGVVLVTFSLTGILGGNGLLAVYIAGIFMGNSKITHKVSLVRFFDGITWIMQILLFFTLGLLSSPSGIRSVWLDGMVIGLIVMFIARPVAVFLICGAFRRPLNENLLVSWVGFRGAAAVVFAIYPLVAGVPAAERIFNIVFFVILLSVMLQGSLLVPVARKLGLVGEEETVLKTFTDYSGEFHRELLEVEISKDSDMDGKSIMEVPMPDDVLIVTIKRGDQLITPRGSTVILGGDKLLLAADSRRRLEEIDRLARAHGAMHRL